MVSRKTRPPRRYEGGNDEPLTRTRTSRDEGDHERRDNNGMMVTRRISTGRINTRSQIVVETMPPQQQSERHANGHIARDKQVDKPMTIVTVRRNAHGQFEKERTVTLDSPAIKQRKASTDVTAATPTATPVRSANGSASGTASTSRPHRINTRSRGSARSTSSDSSSEPDDTPMESLTDLNASLELSQSRISTLSTNYSRLMRLVLDEELEIIDREIAQVKSGSYERLRMKYKEALKECEAKQERARHRLVAAEHEIDIRFGAMIETEWSQFHNDKKTLREKMCEELSSSISQLQQENDEAKELAVNVRPSSTLQQAPWWVKIPKQFTWYNLPDGVNEEQADKDLAKMGIHRTSSDEIGLRTPSPDHSSRKRKRHEERKEHPREEKRYFRDLAKYDESENWSSKDVGGLDSLLRAVADDTIVLTGPPFPGFTARPPPPPPPPPFMYHPPAPPPLLPPPPPPSQFMTPSRESTSEMDYYSNLAGLLLGNQPPPPPPPPPTASLLPRPAQMPYEYPPEQYGPLGNYPPIGYSPPTERRWSMASDYNPRHPMENILRRSPALLSGSFSGPPPPDDTPPQQDTPRDSRQFTPTIPQGLFQRNSVTPQPPKIIGPRRQPTPHPPPIKRTPDPPKLTPIQPHPTPSVHRQKSTSPDVTRTTKRPQSLLPKLSLFQSASSPTPPTDFRPQDIRPQSDFRPTFHFTDPGSLVHPLIPVSAPRMGRFAMMEGGYFPVNAKVAIARHVSKVVESGPLKIAPMPASLAGRGGAGIGMQENSVHGIEDRNGVEKSDGRGVDVRDDGEKDKEHDESRRGSEESSKGNENENEQDGLRRSQRSSIGRKRID